MKRFMQVVSLMAAFMIFAASANAYVGGHSITADEDGTRTFTIGGVDYDLPKEQLVSVSEKGVGDVLIFPLFVASFDFNTQIAVVNTDKRHSNVAKVVVREFDNSKEVIDFYIYLSPGDKWTGIIYADGNSAVRIKSNDDSVKYRGDWANVREMNALVKEFDTNWMGYVEVYNVVSSAADPLLGYNENPALTSAFIGQKIDKDDIWAWFETVRQNTNNRFGRPTDRWTYDFGFESCPLWINDIADCTDPGTVPAGMAVREQYFSGPMMNNLGRNVLAGWSTLRFMYPDPLSSGTLRATALRDYRVTYAPRPTADMRMWDSSVWTNLDEIEAILSKSRVMMPYEHIEGRKQTLHFFNFPTKYNYSANNALTGLPTAAPVSTFFRTWADAATTYLPFTQRIYDMQENMLLWDISPFGDKFESEVNYFDTAFLAARWGDRFEPQGWIDYLFERAENVPYRTLFATANSDYFRDAPPPRLRGSILVADGAPVIPFSLQFDGAGINLSYGAQGDTWGIATRAGAPSAPGHTVSIEGNKIVVKDSDGNIVSSDGPDDVGSVTIN